MKPMYELTGLIQQKDMFLNQPNMADEERLAAMFSKNMSLDPAQVPQEPPKIVYVSQHYTHSAHVAQTPVAIELEFEPRSPRPASEPPQREHVFAEAVLREHGVDPAYLSTSQLKLFTTAEEQQQRRLIELWRICPPTNSNDNPSLAWNAPSTLEQEVVMAKERYMRSQMQPQQYEVNMEPTYTEPYMLTGYAAQAPDVPRAAAYKPSTDPVYNGTCMVDYSELEKMENQYGRTMDF